MQVALKGLDTFTSVSRLQPFRQHRGREQIVLAQPYRPGRIPRTSLLKGGKLPISGTKGIYFENKDRQAAISGTKRIYFENNKDRDEVEGLLEEV